LANGNNVFYIKQMKKIFGLIAISSLLMLGACAGSSDTATVNPVLSIEGGKVQGVLLDSTQVIVYKGVPFAAAPVGDLRWKKPQPVIPWEGVMVASEFKNASVQAAHTPDSFYGKEFFWQGDAPFSEDCLQLNVWTPANAAGNVNAKLPVAMWVHGGAYSGGWSFEPEMDGEAWAERGVILVTVNYRLGLLGFMSHPLLSAEEGENGVSGNYGTYDQVAALKWVYNNIAQFGGNPDDITILGQSAGAASIKNLVSSPLSKGMVKKAIIQSGGGLGTFIPTSTTIAQQEEMGKKMMDAGGYTTLEAMRAATPEELTVAMQKYQQESGVRGIMLSPYEDGLLLTEDFDAAVYNKDVADVPYMIGWTGDDIFPMDEAVARFAAVRDSLSTQPTYVYKFDRKLPGDDAGAFHSSELWYEFHTLDRSWRPFTDADYELADRMVEYWTNFAKYGNPNGQVDGEWKTSTQEAPFVMLLNVK